MKTRYLGFVSSPFLNLQRIRAGVSAPFEPPGWTWHRSTPPLPLALPRPARRDNDSPFAAYVARRQRHDLSHRLRHWFGTSLSAALLLAWGLALSGSSSAHAQTPCCPDLGPIKWVQTPNLFSNITVNASQGVTLADDFRCTDTGPVVDIHIWGGWLNDQVDPNAVFTLSIWSDVPAVTNGPAPIPSHPGQLLWSQPFGPGQYSQCPYVMNGGPFFDPRVPGDIGGMQTLYYLCFNPVNPFVQQGTAAAPTNYWLSLSVQSDPTAGQLFGWRDSLDAYNDTAVWVQGPPPPPGAWNELKGDAPFYRPLNMAFKVITSTNQPPPVCVDTNTIKFEQPPNIDAGFDVWDNGPWLLADDFNCTDTGPITDIHLWASWLNDQSDPNTTFWLGIYSDVPKTTNADGSVNPSHPGDLQWEQWFGPGQYAKVPAGNGQEQFLDPGPPALMGFDSQAWYYCFYPTNPFVQLGTAARPTNYWLAAYAQRPSGSTNQFGWKSSIIQQYDISVHAPWPGGAPPNPWPWQPTITTAGIPLDLAFKITTATNQCPPPTLLCSNRVVECGTTWTLTPPAVFDQCCPGNVSVTPINIVTNGTCPKVIAVTWQATDCRGLTATCTQTITVVDTTPPTLICGTNKTIECGIAGTVVFDPPYVYDACCTNVVVSVLGTVTNGVCPQVLTRTWLAVDCCGNSNTCSQTVTVVDTTPPVITCSTNKTVQCGSSWTFDPPSAYDTCCTNVTVLVLNTVTNGQCPQQITRTWVAVDCCNNRSTCSQTVTVIDTTPPVITCSTNKTVQCGSTWTFDTPSAYDNCCTNVTVSVLNTVTNGQCPQQITRTWEAVDCCNNRSACSQTVTVIDTTPPVLICGTNKTIECGIAGTTVFDPPYAYDACCTNVTVLVRDTVTNGICPQVLTRTWVAFDCCGNSNTCSQTVTVVDTTPPVIICATNKTVQCGSTWTFDPPYAYDTCCSNVTVSVLGTVTNGFCPEQITRTWIARDCCGNSNTCSQTVTVVNTTPPVIVCPPDKTVECGTPFTFDPPTASSPCCGTNVTVLRWQTVTNGICPKDIVVNWLALDCCGNSNVCSQIIHIIDTTPPTITCPSNIVVETCNSNTVVTWTVTATDSCSTNVTVVCTPPSGSTFARDTTNHIHCVATDACGNTNSCDFLVIVLRPTLKLTIVRHAGTITLTWTDGVLQEAPTPFGPWSDVPGAMSPYTTGIGSPHRFYRLRCP